MNNRNRLSTYIEIGAGEDLFLNVGAKLGSRSFYNIFHFGMRWDTPATVLTKQYSWGLGYGIGTVKSMSTRSDLNLEVLAVHISEGQLWESRLNLLNKLRLNWAFRMNNWSKIYVGPVANVLVHRPDSNVDPLARSSSLAPYTLYETTSRNGTEIKFWLGLNAGLRF